jgi:hypothetical protein
MKFARFKSIGSKLRLAILGLCLMAAPLCYGQGSTATLGGNVFDSRQNAVPNAMVVVTSDETGVRRTTSTNGAGAWRVDALVAGHYHFSVAANGFKTEEHSSVDLQIQDQTLIDIVLAVGSSSESVVVHSTPPLIDTTAAISGTVLTIEQLQELPTQENSPLEFVGLAPGVNVGNTTSGAAFLWSNSSQSNISVNGAGFAAPAGSGSPAINYVLDGGTDTFANGGLVAFIPPMDAVAQVRVMTNAYDASIGRSAAATVEMSIKSGTTQFHGVLYERNQNNALDAKVYGSSASTPAPQLHFNEYGGTVGGPVWLPRIYDGRKKGTFFFFSYDAIRSISPSGQGTISVPTAQERTGDFSQSYTTSSGQSYPIIPYDPVTIDPKTGNRQRFPGAVIPSGRISPIAAAYLAMLPLPNQSSDGTSSDGNNFVMNSPKVDLFSSWLARFDQNWNNNHHSSVNLRYNQYSEIASGPFGLSVPIQQSNGRRHNYGLTLNHAWVVSANLVVSATGNVTSYTSPSSSYGVGLDPTSYHFSQALASLQPVKGIPAITGLSVGATLGAFNGPTYDEEHLWEGTGFVTHTKGNHTLRYGLQYLLGQNGHAADASGMGTFNFGSQWTTQNPNATAPPGVGSTLADFLLGLPSNSGTTSSSTSGIVSPASAFWSQRYLGFFGQDDWRVTPRLTFNIGLRWDAQFALTERFNRYFSRFDPNMNLIPVTNYAQPNYAQLLAGPTSNIGVALLQQQRPSASSFEALGGILYAGVNGTSRAATDPRYNYFQPRLGFAYRWLPNTVIRGGLGRFVQATFATNSSQVGFSSTTPFVATTDNYFTPASTLDNPFPNGLVPVSGSSLGPLTSAGSITSFSSPKAQRPYVDSANLMLEQQVKSFLFDIAGVVSRTRGLTVGYQINNPSVSVWQAALGPQFDATGRPLDTLSGNTQVANPFLDAPDISNGLQNQKTVTAYQLLQPNPLTGGITENFYNGKSNYYALQTKVERRYGNGFGLLSDFTWAKQLDTTGYFTSSVVSQKLHKVISPNDLRFLYNFNPTYELPFGRGKFIGGHSGRLTDAFIGGWLLSATYRFTSGAPVQLPTNANVGFFEGGDPSAGSQRSAHHWFNTSLFAPLPTRSTTTAQLAAYPGWTHLSSLPGYSWTPTSATDATRNGVYNDFTTRSSDNPTTFGDVRNSYLNNWNLGLRKSVTIHESIRLQLRFDAFNAFNHPQYTGPGTTPTSQYFGWLSGSNRLTAANTPRAVQLAGKLYF